MITTPKIIALSMLLLLGSPFGMAAPAVGLEEEQKSQFSVDEANKTFERIDHELSVNSQNLDYLKIAVFELEAIEAQAKKCVDETQYELNTLNDLLSEGNADLSTSKRNKDATYIQEKQKRFGQSLSECKLMGYRAKKSVEALKTEIQQLTTSKTFAQSTPIWELFSSTAAWNKTQWNMDALISMSGWTALSHLHLFLISILVLLSASLSRVFSIQCHQWLLKLEPGAWPSSLIKWLKKYAFPLLALLFLNGFLTIVYHQEVTPPLLLQITSMVSVFAVILGILQFIFLPPLSVTPPFDLDREVSTGIFVRATTVLVLLLTGVIASILLSSQAWDAHVMDGLRTLYITALSTSMLWFCWFFTKLSAVEGSELGKGLDRLLQIIFISVFALIFITEWAGYHSLAYFLVKGLILSSALVGVSWMVLNVVDAVVEMVDESTEPSIVKIRHILGVDANQKMIEFWLMKLAINAFIVLIMIGALLTIWESPPLWMDAYVNGVYDGFNLANFKINPSRWLAGFFLFAVLLLLSRGLTSYVAQGKRFRGQKDTQNAISAITSYVMFAVSLCIALLVSGVDFTGFAIIAGALSVGIGLGLQNIVNNFVSGIILLLEKPIKPGDRIVIGQTEGYVKRVRMRSTHLTTMNKVDVIIPNSDLITQQISNFMYKDKTWKGCCKVGVAYGSDLNQVKDTLMSVALAHPEVLTSMPNEPVALAVDFSNSNINFELWFVIDDVNRRSIVLSDLLIGIDRAFREQMIEMAFTQVDIRIKDAGEPA